MPMTSASQTQSDVWGLLERDAEIAEARDFSSKMACAVTCLKPGLG